MRFLKDKRRAGIVALLGATIGAATLTMAGAAQAGTYPCGDEPFPEDVFVDFGGTVYAGLDRTAGDPEHGGFWACYGVTGGEAGDFNTGVGYHSHDPARLGGTVEVVHCDPGGGCFAPLAPTGAEVGVPSSPSPNEPGGGNGTGGTVTGGEVCTWANGVKFCPVGSAPTTVTVAEDDLIPIVETAPSCVYLDGDCLVPTVSGARVTLFPDTAHDTLLITTGPDYDRTDVRRTCIGVNYACP